MEFGHTTISNLQGTDDWLWVHVLIAILFFPLGILFMRHFSVGLKITLQEHGNGSNDNSVESRYSHTTLNNVLLLRRFGFTTLSK